MDGTVNDFFNEIDQIAPPKEPKNESVWQECYDNTSGYTYYWNVKTDVVTWEMPEEYKLWKEGNTEKPSNLYVPPKSSPLFPSTALSTTKIYKIQEDSEGVALDERKVVETDKSKNFVENNKHAKQPPMNMNNKKEKVILISSYGEDSESEVEIESHTRTVNIVKDEPVPVGPHLLNNQKNQTNSKPNSHNNSDNEEEDIDLLTQIQNRAKVLKDLGGELPPAVQKLVEENGSETKTELQQLTNKKEKNDVTGFSLVAGYGDSEDEEEEQNDTKSVVPQTTETKTSHSTLFPITKHIDVRQFAEVKKEPQPDSTVIDSKAFYRKRRIGIELSNKITRPEPYPNNKIDDVEGERQGLGFKKEKESESTAKNEARVNYPGFKSGGVMFVKSDVLNPNDLDKKETVKEEISDGTESETLKRIEETHTTLNEKLTFLGEGREQASPVQVMIIQMQTLYEAMKAGGLTVNYLHKWLKETCSELIKLEKEAAPNGWLLQWDRINKRYYYRNQQTGESQWEYPQPDIVGGDDAMDISTTPPPPPIDDLPVESVPTVSVPIQPPPPPRIKSPTPPPPPTISKSTKQKRKGSAKSHDNPPLPDEAPPNLPPLPAEKFNPQGEPLPPGVDSSEVGSYESPAPSTEDLSSANDVLGSALNSFYSDLAAMESEVKTPPVTVEAPQQNTNDIVLTPSEVPAKKKKKTKVKIVQGLAMKKKGVSKLVERWKNVQKDYN